MKKSYNPFKMFGSYAGILLIPIIHIVTYKNRIWYFLHYSDFRFGLHDFDNYLVNRLPLLIILGFLIGWGIHSLWRHFKK